MKLVKPVQKRKISFCRAKAKSSAIKRFRQKSDRTAGHFQPAGDAAELFRKYEPGLARVNARASEFDIACAAFGLILGDPLGGPTAGRLIKKRGLKSADKPENLSETGFATEAESPPKHYLNVDNDIGTILALALCLGIGDAVNRCLFKYQMRLPGFLTARVAGRVITNLSDPLKIKLNREGIDRRPP